MTFRLSPGSIHMPQEDISLSSEQVANLLVSRTRLLSKNGLQAGDRVFIRHGNCINFFIDLLACWVMGACVVPLEPELTRNELGNLLRKAKPRLFLDATGCPNTFRETLEMENTIVVETGDQNSNKVAAVGREDVIAQINAAQGDALILFTSGSTGEPKGVVHTHAALRAKWQSLSREITPDTLRRTLCILPTHFGHGLICNALFPWLSGNALFLLPPFSPTSLMGLGSLLARCEITFFSSVPAIWQLVLKTPKPVNSKLVEVFCGSAPLSEHLWREVIEWCGGAKVRNVYGITETGSWIAGSANDSLPADGLVGYPWGGQFAVMPGGSIDHCPSEKLPCAVGQKGYIWVKTSTLMKGYLERDDWTAEKISDNWFSTGDIGFIYESGQLVLKGRERDEINRGGLKIYPVDIEAVVSRFPGVIEACCFACDDPVFDQSVGVSIATNEEVIPFLADLYEWTSEHLPSYKIPTCWFRVDGIPKSNRGKINRKELALHCAGLEPLNMARFLKAVN